MNSEILADELAALIQSMTKGQYLLLCAAIEANGGQLVIDPDAMIVEAHRMPPRIEVEALEHTIRIKLPA